MRYFFVLIVSLFLWGTSATLYAQISVNFNIGVQPIWGPTGYDYAEYYYLPDIDCYYYVPLHRFYYFERGRWIYRSSLPSRYGHYDLYNSYKVVVNERDPWRNDATYRQKYASYKGRHDQQPIRDSRDSKYFVNPNHPQHNAYIQQQKHDNGNHFGQNKGNTPIENNRSPVNRPNTVDQRPTTTRQNTIGQRPTTTRPNTIGQRPTTNRQNTIGQRPTTNRQNTVDQRPTTTRQNTIGQRPTTTRQNTVNQRPTVVKQNNGNKGNSGKGNVNNKGNDKGKGNSIDKGNGKDK
jgi:hypothetical protein